MRKLSLYASRYHEFDDTTPINAQYESHDVGTRFTDLANVSASGIEVTCYPTGRGSRIRWRKVDNKILAILPFVMQVRPTRRMKLKLNHCEIQIILCSSCPESIQSGTVCSPVSEETTNGERNIWLLDKPLPDDKAESTTDRKHSREWSFSSNIVNDMPSSPQFSVGWKWESENNLDHYPNEQLGAIAIEHKGERFYVTCKVEGSARRFPLEYRFRNKRSQNRWWPITPEKPHDCGDMRNFDAEYRESTRPPDPGAHAVLNPQTSHVAAHSELPSFNHSTEVNATRQYATRAYGATNMTGSSTGHFGDNYDASSYQISNLVVNLSSSTPPTTA